MIITSLIYLLSAMGGRKGGAEFLEGIFASGFLANSFARDGRRMELSFMDTEQTC